jgi:hypothetical protein
VCHTKGRICTGTASASESKVGHNGVVEPLETRYVEGPRGALAYQVLGSGPPDLVVVPGMHSHLDLQWQFRHP